jgi:hypothetical protein
MPALESVQLALAKKKKSARRVAYYARRGRDANGAFAAGMPTPDEVDEVATGGAVEAATSEVGSSSREAPCARASTPPCIFVAEDDDDEGMEDDEGESEDEEEEVGEALYEAEAARLSQHSGPPTEEREGDAENALDDEEEGVSYEEEGVGDEEEDVGDEDEDEDADGEEEDAREDAELAEGLVEEMVEELVEDEQQPQLDAGPAVEDHGMQSGDDTVLLMHMEQDAQ